MPDADPNQALIDARANLKDTAKWIVTILGATIVLVIGGGLIAKIADLDWLHRLLAAGSLLVLTIGCLFPLLDAIDIVAASVNSFREIATSLNTEQVRVRAIVDALLAQRGTGPTASLEGLYAEFERRTEAVTHAATDPNTTVFQRQLGNAALGRIQPYVREAIELANTQLLRLKFNQMLRRMRVALFVIGAALFVFLISLHTDTQTEKQLAQPTFLQVPWNAEVEAALTEAGLKPECFAHDPPQLLQVSEKSGLRAGVLVIPKEFGPTCPVVRVIVTDTDQVLPDK